MPINIDDKRSQAKRLYKRSKGKKPLKDIAVELGVSEGTIRSWKSRDDWNISATRSATSYALQPKIATQDIIRKENLENTGLVTATQNATRSKTATPQQRENAEKYGFFSLLKPGTLTADELIYFEKGFAGHLDTIAELERQLLFCDIKITRHMNKIKELETKTEATKGMLLSRAMSKKGIDRGEDTNLQENEMQNVETYIDRLMAAVSRELKMKTNIMMKIEEVRKMYGEDTERMVTDAKSVLVAVREVAVRETVVVNADANTD